MRWWWARHHLFVFLCRGASLGGGVRAVAQLWKDVVLPGKLLAAQIESNVAKFLNHR